MITVSRVLTAGLMLALLGATAGQAAIIGELNAESATFQAASVDASGGILWIQEAESAVTQTFGMSIQAASIEGEQRQLTTTYVRTPEAQAAGVPSFAQPLDAGERDDRLIAWTDARLESVAFRDLFRLAVGFDDATMHATMGAFEAVAADSATVCQVRLSPGGTPCNAVGPDEIDVHNPTFEGPLVLAQSEARSFRLVLEGDLHLQIGGIDFETATGERIRGSNDWTDAAGPLVQDETRRLLVLSLKEARVEIWSNDLAGVVDWAAPQQTAQPAGRVVLSGASGVYRGGLFNQEPLDITDIDTIHLQGTPESLRAVMHTGVTPQGTIGSIPDRILASAFLAAGALAALALIGGAGWLVWARRRQTMEDVEAAIEAKQFLRAARTAGRIARRNPDDEAPVVARAVALSKAGHHDRVVSEVTRRLADREPADGVLHYVLGLAYLEMDAEDEAFMNLQEAVRRTPSLERDVSAHVGKVPYASSPIYV